MIFIFCPMSPLALHPVVFLILKQKVQGTIPLKQQLQGLPRLLCCLEALEHIVQLAQMQEGGKFTC